GSAPVIANVELNRSAVAHPAVHGAGFLPALNADFNSPVPARAIKPRGFGRFFLWPAHGPLPSHSISAAVGLSPASDVDPHKFEATLNQTARRRIGSAAAPKRLRRIADRAIPRRVAPLQSPLPLHPALAREETDPSDIA